MPDKYPWQRREKERREKRRPQPKRPVPQRIKPRTAEGAKEDRLYSKMRIVFLEEHPVCECGRAGCTGIATQVHHKRGRGIWYLIVSTWLAVCDACHKWIGANSKEAMRLGFTDPRIT